MKKETKLILLRGNSGSGKTTTGKALQKKFGRGTLLISQDVVRRDMLYVKDGVDPECSQLLLDLLKYGKKNCDVVILEGILDASWYNGLFESLFRIFENQIFAYYFDVPFEETLKRHGKKSNAHEFGETEMRSWWQEKDLLKFIPEQLLSMEMSLEHIVELVYIDAM